MRKEENFIIGLINEIINNYYFEKNEENKKKKKKKWKEWKEWFKMINK